MEVLEDTIEKIAQMIILKVDEYSAKDGKKNDFYALPIFYKDFSSFIKDEKIFYQYLCRMKNKKYIEYIKTTDLDTDIEPGIYYKIKGRYFPFLSELKTDEKGDYFEEDAVRFYTSDGTFIEWAPYDFRDQDKCTFPGIFEITVSKDFEAVYKRRSKLYKSSNKDDMLPLSLPKGTTWENITIKFKNSSDVEIWIKDSFFISANNRDMGLYKTNKDSSDEDADKQWEFLRALSVTEGEYDLGRATSPGKKDIVKQQKKKLSDILKLYFSVDSNPFYSCKETNSYKTRFKMEPDPNLRGDGEMYNIKNQKETHYLDNFLEEETSSKISQKRKY